MERLELLYDHYKESYALSKDAQSNRNKVFLCLIVTLLVNLLFAIDPLSIMHTITSWLKESHGVDMGLQSSIIQVFLWLILLYFSVRYIQLNCYIERQYKFIHKLESRIAESSSEVFDRESKNYLDSYPLALDFIHIIYTWIFPIVFEIAIIIKIIIEIRNASFGIPIVASCVICVCVFVVFLLYFCFLRKNELREKKTKTLTENN